MPFVLFQRLDGWARSIFPFCLTLVMMVLGATPLHVPFLQALGPVLAMISAFYWAIHRPTLLPAPAVFVIGLVGDLMGQAPLGVGTVMLLLVYVLAYSQRRLFLGQPFLVVWWGFMMIVAGAMALGWILAGFVAGAPLDPKPAIFAYVMAIALYPALADLFARAQRSLLRPA